MRAVRRLFFNKKYTYLCGWHKGWIRHICMQNKQTTFISILYKANWLKMHQQLQNKQLTMLDEIHVYWGTNNRQAKQCMWKYLSLSYFVVIYVRHQANNFTLQGIINHRPHVHIFMEETLWNKKRKWKQIRRQFDSRNHFGPIQHELRYQIYFYR